MKRIISVFLVLILLAGACPVLADGNGNGKIKNIIYMIPDGGGIDPFNMANELKKAGGWDEGVYPNATPVEKGEMYAKKYLVGAVTTNSANASVTDSAAAGTALSSGYKTNNGLVGVDPDLIPRANILEAAQYAGKKTGMVTTYEWTNATPAAFSAHEVDRGIYSSMSKQIVNQGIDVVLGCGFGSAQWGTIAEAEKRGYNVMNTREDLENVKAGDKLWGNLVSTSFPYDIEKSADTPSIAEMTKAAITALNDGEEGFFLMVEGSKVDGGGHSNSVNGMLGEFLAFDEACKVALEFAEERTDTLVVIVPDHDTGGMNIPEEPSFAANIIKTGAETDAITWETTGHTARKGGLFIYKPMSVRYPDGISGTGKGKMSAYKDNVIDNTDIAPYLAKFMETELDDITDKLFVDVTDMGKYDMILDMFLFNDYPVSAVTNASYAVMEGKVIDLEGQVCLRINGRYYVPQLLLDIMEGKKDYDLYEYEGIKDTADMTTYMPDSTDITKWMGQIKVTNFVSPSNLTGKIVFTAPESFKKLEPISIDVPPTSTKTYEFECAEFDAMDREIVFKYDIVTDDGKVVSFESDFEGMAYAGYTPGFIKIDGIIDDAVWKNGAKMKCNTASDIVMIENWKGERDLSAEFSILWDEDNFYMYAVVTDEIFYPQSKVSNLWNGDSVQFGIYRDSGNNLKNGTAGTKFEEIGIAFINDTPSAYRYISQNDTTATGEIPLGDGFEMACVRSGDDMIYELKLSWEKLLGEKYTPKIGDILGFSAVINDNDGEGRRGWMEYGSGIGTTKNVNQFVVMPLLDSSKRDDGVKVFVNGKMLISDVAPVIIEDRVLVPVRAIFEAIGATVEWEDDTQTAVSAMDGKNVRMQIGNKVIVVDGVEKEIDVPAQLVNSRTLAPVRAVSESFGCTVEWDDVTQTVTITK